MKQFTRRVRRCRRAFFDIRIVIACIGLLLSIILHELLHVMVHWGDITHIQLFPSTHAIVEITAITATGYDPLLEEVVAYAISFMVLFITIAILFRMGDRKDTRTFTQIVFPKEGRMQALDASERYELALRAKVF